MRHVCTLLLLLTLSPPARAQKEFNVWCFGSSIMLNFSGAGALRPPGTCAWPNGVTSSQTIVTFGAPGSASICDAQGELLFYSNGTRVIDRRQQIMANGNLNSVTNVTQSDNWWVDPSRQSCAIAPGPNGCYYIFYWSQATTAEGPDYSLSYATVDMRQNAGYGAVVEKRLLTLTSNPRVTIVRHRNNRDFWILTRDLESRGFQAFLLDKKGVSNSPVVSLAEVALYPNLNELKAAPNGRRLVCGALTRTDAGPQSCVCVYDFDNATGRVANELVVQRNPTEQYRSTNRGRPLSTWQFAHASFSPNSQLLYSIEYYPALAGLRHPNDLWQYDLSQPTPEAITRSRYRVSNAPLPSPPVNHPYFYCSGLQLAPDATLWMANYTGNVIDPVTGQFLAISSPIIRHPNVAGPGCDFERIGYTYLPGQGALAFPNLITNMLYAPPTLNHEVGCADDSVRFWASSAGLPVGLRWDFGEPASGPANTATGGQVAHRYARGGTYPVRLILADGRILAQDVTVTAQTVDFTGANVFTPNDDGLNDAFVPVRQPLPGGHLQVYGRWGQSVFSTDDPALRWNGAGAAAGEYFYQLDYPDCAGVRRHRRGTLTLVR